MNEKQRSQMTAQVTRYSYWKGRYPVTGKKLHTWGCHDREETDFYVLWNCQILVQFRCHLIYHFRKSSIIQSLSAEMTAQITRYSYWKGRYPVTGKKLHTWGCHDREETDFYVLWNCQILFQFRCHLIYHFGKSSIIQSLSVGALSSYTRGTARRLNLRKGIQSISNSPTPNLIHSKSVCNNLPHLSFRFSNKISCMFLNSPVRHTPRPSHPIPSDIPITISDEKHNLLPQCVIPLRPTIGISLYETVQA